MSTDLIERIATLARQWEEAAPPVTLGELTAGRSAVGLGQAQQATVIDLDRHVSHRGRLVVAIATAAAVAAGFVAVVVTRNPDAVEPVGPSTATAAPETALATIPGTTPITSAAPVTSAPTTTAAPVDFAVRLTEIDAARADALRLFSTIGFTVHHTSTQPDGTVTRDDSASVVLSNDGSSAVASDAFLWSYYDATTGTARTGYVDADGQTAYQELAGQADNSVALGVPTGLPNGIVEQFPLYPDDVVAVEDDVVDGRPTWRIDREYPSQSSSTSTWIDVQTGVTLQSRSVGMQSTNGVPQTDTLTLSDLQLGASMPADFPGTFPDGAVVNRSGDPTQFSSSSVEDAATLFGVSIVVPTTPADVMAVSTMNFGNDDGTTTSSPSLIVRWFDGFLRTEYRLSSFPPSMPMPDSCESCTGTLLDELKAWSEDGTSLNVSRDGLGISITGPNRQAVQDVIDSLVQVG
jgi:hypothetical protein